MSDDRVHNFPKVEKIRVLKMYPHGWIVRHPLRGTCFHDTHEGALECALWNAGLIIR